MNSFIKLTNAIFNPRSTQILMVNGTIRLPDNNPLVNVIVKAFDKDLRQEELLGETTTNTNGFYEISYTPAQFSRAEKDRADIIIRVFNRDQLLLKASDIRFNASRLETIDLTVDPLQVPKPSEFEILITTLAPVLGEVSLADLTDEDAVFLAGEVKLGSQPLTKEFFQALRQAAQNAQQTNLPIEVFYGFYRANLPLDLEQLLAQPLDTLRQALLRSIEGNIIPQKLRDSLDQIIDRLEQLQIERGILVRREFTGRLLNQTSGVPLAGYTVQTLDLDATPAPKDLGTDLTNGQGLFVVAYFIPRSTIPQDGQPVPNRRFRLQISNPQGETIHETDLQIPINQQQTVEIRVPIPDVPEPPSPTLEDLETTLQLDIPAELRSFLRERNILTLADIRRVGGISQLEGLPVAANLPAIHILDAQANLSSLSSDLTFNATLIDQGYTSPVAIAKAPRPDFVNNASQKLGDFKAAQLQVLTRAQTQFLNNVLTGLQADSANGFVPPISPHNLPIGETCRCQDCESAVSPSAYLVDLLDYALNHLKNNDVLIDLPFLTETFHQPFGDLPTSCSSAEKQVRQVRLCIEVLRRYLAANPPIAEQQALLTQAEKNYRQTAYTTLLNQLGTSYEELRLARTALNEDRQDLANQLGISLSDRQLPLGDELDRLFLDPTIDPPTSKAITESVLEKLFGLADTTRNPLSEGAKLGDDQEQIKRWNLSGVEWNRNTDADGQIYLSLFSGIAGPIVEVYRDRDRTQKVAGGSQLITTVELSPDNDSGLSGSLDLDYKADSTNIEITVVPNFLSWQLRQLRSLWQQQDNQRTSPLIDPDLINLGDLKNPTIGAPVYDLWQARRNWIDDQLTNLQTTPKTLDGLATLVQNTLTLNPAEPVTLDRLVELDAQRQEGTNITGDLKLLSLSLPAFDYILRIRNLLSQTAPIPILDSEWSDVYSILVQVQKRRRFEDWKTEESDRNLTLSPDYFQIPVPDFTQFPPPPPPALPTWRATQADRRDWQDTLQTRIEQEQTVINALLAIVSKTEEETLPALRDALILATNVAGNTLEPKAKQLTDRLLIDTRIDGCQTTTRTAQAIESLQNLLFSIRTRQLNGTYPDLILDTDNFDEEWKWIGSYSTWRAAMLVFLYPENILLPSLRKRQTPAFRTLVENLRSNSRLTPEQACQAAKTYADYFQDVASLTLEATCQTLTRIYKGESCRDRYSTDYRSLFYLFARGGKTNTVYWSAYDATDESGYAQTFWAPVQGLKNVINIIGAVPYERTVDERFIYLFARVREEGEEKLVFIKYDLEKQNWDGEQKLLDELPENTTTFTIAIEQRSEEDIPPHLVISNREGKIFSRRLKADGSNWEDEDFLLISDPQIETQKGLGRPQFKRIKACVAEPGKAGGDADYLFVERQDGSIDIQLFTRHQDFPIPIWIKRGYGTWVCAFQFDDRIYAFFKQGTLVKYIESSEFVGGSGYSNLSNLEQIAVHCGQIQKQPRLFIGCQKQQSQRGLYRIELTHLDNAQLAESSRVSVAPHLGPLEITEKISEAKLQLRGFLIWLAFLINAGGPQSNFTYLEEAYYFVPVHLALQLQSRGQYTAALDWFRTVYDYSMPIAQRKIYYGLKREESPTVTYDRAPDWLLDPLNPHEIAATRANTYTRFTLLALIRCFLEFADAEFTRDTAESLARARTLYLTALELLDLPEIKQQLDRCEEFINSLDVEINEPEWLSVWNGIKTDLTQIHNSQALTAVVNELKQILATSEPIAIRLAQARSLVDRARTTQPAPPTLARVIAEKSRRLAQAHANLLTQPVIAQAVQKVGKLASQDYLQTVAIVSGLSTATLETEKVELPWLRQRLETAAIGNGNGNGTRVGAILTARDLPTERFANAPLIASSRTATLIKVAQFAPLRAVELVHRTGGFLPSAPAYGFCIVPNPVIDALRLRVELNLYKLRTCRNIAGVERQIDPYAAPTDAESGLPQIGAGGQLVLPGTVTFQPTPYRYGVLIERAKQLVQLAAQIESSLLSALEKRDTEYFNLLKARQDVRLTRAGVRLQDLRVKEAEDGVKLAELQLARSQIQADYYRELINDGLLIHELRVLDLLQKAINRSEFESIFNLVLGGGISLSSTSSLKASLAQTQANFERRREEWEFQLDLAQQDIRIGNQQITISEGQVRIVGQERNIAMMQADNAEEVVNFLRNKFTNVDLYDWMSNILERVYSFFLQQATAMATLAENQLAFERQQIPPSLIQADYWEAPTDTGVGGNINGNAPARRGLTGSARLLQDIFQLDQYAFDTNQRKLQLTKIISLAQLAPAEFQRFRETGVMLFSTPMELFDRDFPGHYLRLIKRVRTSVIALIPPTQSIHATLTTTSISRVVLGGDVFQTGIVRRDPETVALSSPNNATGLFELEPQSEFLFPFEGIGVDTAWEFQLPKAANLFDYNTIADVLITIEYTALNSFAYRQQIIQQLNQSISADRPFSFRNQFADQWYDLNNPELTATPMTVRFKTVREDFPPNIENLRIQHIVLYFALAAGQSFEIPVTLNFTAQGSTGPAVGGGATSKDGIISTRRGNASSWMLITNDKSPVGEWELSLPNTDEIKQRFRDEQIEDILFVITYSGRTPEWPT